jgi:hypothetical protein
MEESTRRAAGRAVLILFAALWLTAASGFPAQGPGPEGCLYKTTFLRAAPGKLLDLIALLKERMAFYDAAGDERPLWWRHTQGDQWDLMLLIPMGGYGDYYAPERVARRGRAAESAEPPNADFLSRLDECVSWREDLFVFGPPLAHVKASFQAAAYYHIEIMAALAGKRKELLEERRMESAYQVAMGRPEYMVFVGDQGAGWDVFTLACYRDLAHWAESPGLTKERRQAAAEKAGFPSSEAIGPYMRTLIDFHRDTMGVAIQ